jgi:hypothetical protein
MVCGGESEVARALGFDVVGSLNVILLFPGNPVELADVSVIHKRQSKLGRWKVRVAEGSLQKNRFRAQIPASCMPPAQRHKSLKHDQIDERKL